MTYRFFEGKDHASIYQKYRFTPPDGLKDIVLQYLDEKKRAPHALAVDLGCGSGQNSRLFAPHFQEVVGLDVSECQLEEARAVPGCQNITYRTGSAEELPFPDGSVDLLTAASAAHWFDQGRFLSEASRVLRPRGCMALLGSNDTTTRFHHDNCAEQLNKIYQEVRQVLRPYTSKPVIVCETKLEELYSAIPFPDKERIESFQVKSFITLKNLLGFIQTWSMFQAYEKRNAQTAKDLLLDTQRRFLCELGVTSTDTEIEWELDYFCVLASKPQ